MRVEANVFVLAKISKPWKDSAGNVQTSYSANIMQDKGTIIDTIRLNQEQFSQIEPNQSYVITSDFGTGRNGAYLRVVDIRSEK